MYTVCIGFFFNLNIHPPSKNIMKYLARVPSSEGGMTAPKLRKEGWHSSVVVRSMLQTRIRPPVMAEGRQQAHNDNRIFVHWCRKYPMASVSNQWQPAWLGTYIAFTSRFDPYKGISKCISCIRRWLDTEAGAFEVAPISPLVLGSRLNTIPSLNPLSVLSHV